jgi:Uma2 family endonuclease
LAVEVLAPNDRPEQILRRVDEQLRFGTRLVWVLDPEARSVSVHRADRTTEVVESDGELTGEDVLPEFRCRVADLFAMPGGAGEHRR